jgi:hypothetical protein
MTVSKRPEVRLPPAEDDRHDVDRHVVDEPSDSACPPTSPAPTPISSSPASSCARAIPSSTEVAKWYDASGCQPVGRGRCDTTTTGVVFVDEGICRLLLPKRPSPAFRARCPTGNRIPGACR